MFKLNLVSDNIAKKVTSGVNANKKYIVIHETANESKGADADAHARLQANGNSRSASWHYSVDDKVAIQSFKDDAVCWHAGNSYYNTNGIAIEICVNSGGNFDRAVSIASDLTRELMSKHKISIDNVIQHNKASGKNCPRYLRSGGKGVKWSDFIARVKGKPAAKPTPNPKPKPKPKPKPTKGYQGTSVVDYLKHNKMDSNFNNRFNLASKYGISGYTGTQSQNDRLLKTLRGGNVSTPKPIAKPNLKVGSTVTLNKSATRFATGQSILNSAKGKQYKIIQVKSDRVLLDGIMSWVYKKDVK